MDIIKILKTARGLFLIGLGVIIGKIIAFNTITSIIFWAELASDNPQIQSEVSTIMLWISAQIKTIWILAGILTLIIILEVYFGIRRYIKNRRKDKIHRNQV